MILAALDFQTLSDAVGLGAIYALMAVGIGLVFGVLRLVNFAYGQLVMAGAYTLAFTSSWPIWAEHRAPASPSSSRSRSRWTRSSSGRCAGQSPAVMLVTTFAIAFLLQAVALIVDVRDGTIGEVAPSLSSLNEAVTIGGTDIRKITLVSIGVAAGALLLLALLLTRTTIGLHTRAAASDFRTARLLGVRANRVIAFSVVLSGLLAAVVAVMMTVQQPFVTPDFALHDTIIVLVGVVVGGIDRLWTATLGGFTIGFASGLINGAAADRQDGLPAVGGLRARDPRPAPAARPGCSPGAAGRRPNAYEAAARPARPARRAGAARRRGRARLDHRLARRTRSTS